ncbi:MAG: CPBP family intramembrane metalloprotease [Spirochaetes bacterium]|nr:CPBP family intramembrane metalloprotease [Spirochaetota bacterium]
MLPGKWPYLMLPVRTLLFFAFGLLFLLALGLQKGADPLQQVTRWWFFQVIFTNIVCFILLRRLVKKEGVSYFSLFSIDRSLIKQDLRIFLLILVPSGILGVGGMFGSSLLLYGDLSPLEIMNQRLPVWASAAALLVFPVTIAFVESPTYFGYCLQRIEVVSGRRLAAFILSVFFLAVQHMGIPMVFEANYLFWRFLSFLPLAAFFGWVYLRIRRLLPLVIVHFLMDLQVSVMVFIMSVRPLL